MICEKCQTKNIFYSRKHDAYICRACGDVRNDIPNPDELKEMDDFLKKIKYLHKNGKLDFLIPEIKEPVKKKVIKRKKKKSVKGEEK